MTNCDKSPRSISYNLCLPAQAVMFSAISSSLLGSIIINAVKSIEWGIPQTNWLIKCDDGACDDGGDDDDDHLTSAYVLRPNGDSRRNWNREMKHLADPYNTGIRILMPRSGATRTTRFLFAKKRKQWHTIIFPTELSKVIYIMIR